MASGVGTSLKVIADDSLPIKHLIIVTPNASVATGDAYQALHAPSLTSINGESILSSSFAEESFGFANPLVLYYDFEEVIFKAEPEIERV